MKRIFEIGAYKSGNRRLEVVDLSALEVTTNKNTLVFVGRTMVTSQIRGQDFSDSYQVSRAYLKRRAQWRIVASQSARVTRPEVRAGNGLMAA